MSPPILGERAVFWGGWMGQPTYQPPTSEKNGMKFTKGVLTPPQKKLQWDLSQERSEQFNGLPTLHGLSLKGWARFEVPEKTTLMQCQQNTPQTPSLNESH